MELEKVIMNQLIPCEKYPEASEFVKICSKYVTPDNAIFAINLGISYGIMLGKRIARRKEETFGSEH